MRCQALSCVTLYGFKLLSCDAKHKRLAGLFHACVGQKSYQKVQLLSIFVFLCFLRQDETCVVTVGGI
jgi:hypothetical protein